MMKKLFYTVLLCVAVLTTSCQQTKEGVIQDINNLVEEVSEEGADYSAEQWEKVNQEFEKLCQEADELGDWTVEESAELAKAKAKYLGAQMKKGSENMMKKAGKALEGFMEGLED